LSFAITQPLLGSVRREGRQKRGNRIGWDRRSQNKKERTVGWRCSLSKKCIFFLNFQWAVTVHFLFAHLQPSGNRLSYRFFFMA